MSEDHPSSIQRTRRWSDLTPDRQQQVRLLLVDALGLAAAGSANADARRVLAGLGDAAPGPLRVPWTDVHLSAPQAATALSTLIHAWDFDDTHDEAVVHTATAVVPAALIAAGLAGAGGTAVLDGVVTGVQVLSRLARLTGPRVGVIRTAGLGALAAAATAATVWGLDDAATESAVALSLGSALAPTTRQAVVDGSVAKRLQPGLAAAYGVTAAGLARAGVVGPAGWLTGAYGIAPDSGLQWDALFSGQPELDQVALKPYPACRYTHGALAAAEVLHVQHPAAAELAEIAVHVPAGDAYRLVSRPYEDRGAPLVDAQFSIPWQLAALWVTGGYDLTTLRDHLGNAKIAETAARVRVHQDLPETTVMAGARVEVVTRDGARHVAEAPMPGSGAHRLSRDSVDRKLVSCLEVAGLPDPRPAADALWSMVVDLPGLDAAATASLLDATLPGLSGCAPIPA